MRRLIVPTVLASMLLVATPSCYTFKHEVGSGGSGGDLQEESAWFAFWGLLPITRPDSHEMAGGSTNYTATTQFKVLDVVISFFTAWVTIYKQTVTVEK